MNIILNPEDLAWVLEGAKERVERRIAAGSKPMQYDGTPRLEADVFGDQGSLAVAYAYHLDREQIRAPEIQAPDLFTGAGESVEVKRVHRNHHRLALHSHRGRACDDDFYVLTGPTFQKVPEGHLVIRIMGWVDGALFAEYGHPETLLKGEQWVLNSQYLITPDAFQPTRSSGRTASPGPSPA